MKALRGKRAVARILTRIDNASLGNFGDSEAVGDGVSEMRIHYGPGYRLYYTRAGQVVYIMLVGGDKASQKKDVIRARAMAKTLRSGTQ